MTRRNGATIKNLSILLGIFITVATFVWNFSSLATTTKLKNEHQDILLAEVGKKTEKIDERIEKLTGVVEKNAENQHHIQVQQKEVQVQQKRLIKDVDRLIKKIDDK